MAPPRRSSRGPSVGDPRGEPSEEGTIRETPWSNARNWSSEEPRQGKRSGEVVSPLPREGSSREGSEEPALEGSRWVPSLETSEEVPRGRQPVEGLRASSSEEGPVRELSGGGIPAEALRGGALWGVTPGATPVAGAPRSPAGEMLRQAGDRGRAGETSSVEAPRSQRRRGGSRGPTEAPSEEGGTERSQGSMPRRTSEEAIRDRPLHAPTKAGRTRLQGIEPDQESVHPASGG
jgi:hypothetical protein